MTYATARESNEDTCEHIWNGSHKTVRSPPALLNAVSFRVCKTQRMCLGKNCPISQLSLAPTTAAPLVAAIIAALRAEHWQEHFCNTQHGRGAGPLSPEPRKTTRCLALDTWSRSETAEIFKRLDASVQPSSEDRTRFTHVNVSRWRGGSVAFATSGKTRACTFRAKVWHRLSNVERGLVKMRDCYFKVSKPSARLMLPAAWLSTQCTPWKLNDANHACCWVGYLYGSCK